MSKRYFLITIEDTNISELCDKIFYSIPSSIPIESVEEMNLTELPDRKKP